MSDEQAVLADFKEATTSEYWTTRDDYTTVNALLLCWEDDDLNSVWRAIVLKSLLVAPPTGFAQRQKPKTSFLFLRVSLVDDPTGLQFANWLKSFPPAAIQDVDIEGLVLKARRLEGLTDHNAIFPGSILGKLSLSAQNEILERLREILRAVSNTAAIAKEAATGSDPAPSGAISDLNFTSNIIDNFKAKVSSVCSDIEGRVLLEPGVDL
ncbi:hypothetical protein MMC25_000188 [Agyrium rufum]|nr:hypothetical protein [Agyrium rufum]